MKHIKYLLGGAIIMSTVFMAESKPAMKGIRTIEQPDGSQLQIRVVGDEHMHFTTTDDGILLHEDTDGFFRLGRIDENGLVVSTGLEISSVKKAEVGIRLTDSIIKEVSERRLKSQGSRRAAPAQSGMGLYSDSYPVIGNTKGLIILVEYSDVSFNK